MANGIVYSRDETLVALETLRLREEFAESVNLLEDLRHGQSDGRYRFIVEDGSSPILRFGKQDGRGHREATVNFEVEEIPAMKSIIDEYLEKHTSFKRNMTEEYVLGLYMYDSSRPLHIVKALGIVMLYNGEF